MTPFEVVNWSLCALTVGLLLSVLWRDRFLLVKPSVWVVVWFHLVIQWAATVRAGVVETYLPEPWTFAGLVHGFPLLTFGVSAACGRRSARHVFYRTTHERPDDLGALWKQVGATVAFIAVYVALYLNHLGWDRTGLYAVLFDPARAYLAREESLKLVESPLIRYGYSVMSAAAAPLAAGSMAVLLSALARRGRLIEAVLLTPVFAAVLVAVSLTGARSLAASLLLMVLFTYFVRRGFAFRPIQVVGGLVAVLLVPTALTLLREGRIITPEIFWVYFSGSILHRVFVVPMEVVLYYVHHAQTTGFFGVSGVPKLASFLGVEPVNVPNLIGLTYVPGAHPTINAGGGFVFTYYSYFGGWVFPLCCVAVWMLDLAVWVYRRLSANTLVTCIAAACVSTLTFTAADFTTVLVTHGFLPVLVLSLVLDRMCRKGLRGGARSALSARGRLVRAEGPAGA